MRSFDPSLDLDPQRSDNGITYYKIGLGDTDNDTVQMKLELDGKQVNQIWEVKKLSSLYAELEQQSRLIDLLKLDIGGDEVHSLRQAIEEKFLQEHVKQLLVEWHLPSYVSSPRSTAATAFRELVNIQKSLRSAGFEAFHAETRYNGDYSFYLMESLLNSKFKH